MSDNDMAVIVDYLNEKYIIFKVGEYYGWSFAKAALGFVLGFAVGLFCFWSG